MKTPTIKKNETLPDIPHAVTHITGAFPITLLVEISVPSRVAAHLKECNGISIIPCAGIGSMDHVKHRIRNWSHPFRGAPSHRDRLKAAVMEGCDTPIRVSLTTDEWHLVGYLCGRLKITPGQWFLGCATYNAEVEEQHLEKKLAEMATAAE